jgi:hypothetical protein
VVFKLILFFRGVEFVFRGRTPTPAGSWKARDATPVTQERGFCLAPKALWNGEKGQAKQEVVISDLSLIYLTHP